jgi:hypothetical protein
MCTPSKLLNNVKGYQEKIYEVQTDEANTNFQLLKSSSSATACVRTTAVKAIQSRTSTKS